MAKATTLPAPNSTTAPPATSGGIDGAQLIEDYINHKRGTVDISKSTARAYETYLTSYVVDAGADKLIEAGDIRGLERLVLSWLNTPISKKEKLTSGTWNRKLAYVKAFFAYLIEKDILEVSKHPLKHIRPRPEDLRILSFGRPEVDKIAETLLNTYLAGGQTASALHLRNYLLFYILSTVGLRSGEAGSFARQQVDVAQGTILIMGQDVKTKYSRQVPLADFDPSLWGKRRKAKSEFQEYFELYYAYHVQAYAPDIPLLCTGAGGPMTATNTWHTLTPVFKACGAPRMRVHDLRHYALTRMALHGGSPVVQQVAGHATPATTARYITPPAHVVCQVARRAMNTALASEDYL